MELGGPELGSLETTRRGYKVNMAEMEEGKSTSWLNSNEKRMNHQNCMAKNCQYFELKHSIFLREHEKR